MTLLAGATSSIYLNVRAPCNIILINTCIGIHDYYDCSFINADLYVRAISSGGVTIFLLNISFVKKSIALSRVGSTAA